MTEAQEFIESYENDIKKLQVKMVSLEREKAMIQKKLRQTELYKNRTEKTRNIKQIRELIEARTRELSGAKKLLNVISQKEMKVHKRFAIGA